MRNKYISHQKKKNDYVVGFLENLLFVFAKCQLKRTIKGEEMEKKYLKHIR